MESLRLALMYDPKDEKSRRNLMEIYMDLGDKYNAMVQRDAIVNIMAVDGDKKMGQEED